jgi:VIT1/CCC1 family predicted Fe2+/Mn2+ transporter
VTVADTFLIMSPMLALVFVMFVGFAIAHYVENKS